MNRRLLTTALVLCLASSLFAAPSIVQGRLDLRDWNFESEPIIRLDGEWEFYWNQHIDGDSERTPSYAVVPGEWNGVETGSGPASGSGFASYRVVVQLPPDVPHLAIHTGRPINAYRFLVNGTVLYQAGIPGRSKDETIPRYGRILVPVPPESDTLDIVFQVSNFHHASAGLHEPVVLGVWKELAVWDKRGVGTDLLFTGIALAMVLYHLALLRHQPKDRSLLWFVLFTATATLRAVVTESLYIQDIFPGIPWALVMKLEYLTVAYLAAMMLAFLRALYPEDVHRNIVRGFLWEGHLYGAIVVFGPTRFFTALLPIQQLVMVIGVLMMLVVMMKVIARKRDRALFVGIGVGALTLAFVNDLLNSLLIIFTGSLLSVGLLVFFMSQAFLLARKHADEKADAVRTSADLAASTARQENLFEEIRKAGRTLSEAGSALEASLVDGSTAVEGIVASSREVHQEISVQSQGIQTTKESTESVAGFLERLVTDISSQNDEIERSTGAVRELLEEVRSMEHRFAGLEEEFRQLTGSSEEGRNRLETMSESVNDVSRRSKGLIETNELIASISSQTNLLSMNAAIEAAHAGEAGRGFAVVAEEIRKLAEQTAEQSTRTGNELREILQEIDRMVESTESVKSSFGDITGAVDDFTKALEEVKETLETQNRLGGRIGESLAAVGDVSAEVKAESAELRTGSDRSGELIRRLEQGSQDVNRKLESMSEVTDRLYASLAVIQETEERNRESIGHLVELTEAES